MAIVISGNGIDMGNNPVSNASQIEVQENQVSPFSGFKNYIINGNFDIWQRGTSQTTSGYGSDDRWDNNNAGSTKTHSRVVCSDVERALFNAKYFSRTVVTSVAGSNNYCIKVHRIEDVTKTAGKTVTLSFWAKADSNKNIAIEFVQIFGTGGTPSPIETGIGAQKIAVSAVWKKYSITVTVPSLIGKTLGTDGAHTYSASLYFWFDAGSNYNYRTANLGQQSGTFDIAQVQLEEGSVATPFENRPYGLELSLCQRYYEECSCWYHCNQVYDNRASTSLVTTFSMAQPKRVKPTFSKMLFDIGTLNYIVLGEDNRSVMVNTMNSNLSAGDFLKYYAADAEL